MAFCKFFIHLLDCFFIKITLENISKRFRYEWIFRDVNYVFETGQKYAILGANGSGKSTLLQILSGILSPTKGKIFYESNDNQSITIEEIYKHISWAAPSVSLIDRLTLSEMLDFQSQFKAFLPNIKLEDALRYTNLAHAKDKQLRYFSSGMKQRVKLVLALLADTDIILLDEPTTNLDEEGCEWYEKMVLQFAKNRLLIIASNQKHEYHFCDKKLFIKDFAHKKQKKK